MAEIKNIKNQARANTMTNLEKYNKIFIGMFHKTEEELPGLKLPRNSALGFDRTYGSRRGAGRGV